jgi:hypothetical protein
MRNNGVAHGFGPRLASPVAEAAGPASPDQRVGEDWEAQGLPRLAGEHLRLVLAPKREARPMERHRHEDLIGKQEWPRRGGQP